MEREDLFSLIAAIIIVIVVALVIKPVLSDETPGFLTPETGPEQEETIPPSTTPAITTVPTPTVPAWDGEVKTIEFVDPASYGISTSDGGAKMSSPPSGNFPSRSMVVYAVVRGSGSGATEIVHIPYPYWELAYDAEVYNTEFSLLNVQVMDADDPNRFVRIITKRDADFIKGKDFDPETRKEAWKEKFYEGNRDYWFVINTRAIKSYTLQILVPERYVTGE
ncbi:MAG: hypothetical protein PWP08_276 [Methanofollis sp.]|nr:hypothetical protein [Methanofollis sp.]